MDATAAAEPIAQPDPDPTPEEQGKDPAAVALGKGGGKALATALTSEQHREIASRAASSRWKKGE
jgi:hypothetical protein